MKIQTFLSTLAVAFTASFAFADAANVLISFSTTADYYADGTPVKDGEWYACCWFDNSNGGVFEGVNPDLTPMDANDIVCLKAPLAKKGRCPYTVFQIDSSSPMCKRTGKYVVILLDTRGANGKPATTLTTGTVTKAIAVQSYTAGSATGGSSTTETTGSGWTASATTPDTPATIKGFRVVSDAQVEIEVADIVPGVKYNVKMGPTLDKISTYGVPIPDGTDEAKFYINQGDARFFQLTRDPLAQ